MARLVYAMLVACLTVCSIAEVSAADGKVLKKATTGKPAIKSIQVLGFAPEGVLLIGDGAGSQIFAIQTGDTTPQGSLTEKIEKIEEKLAGRLGTTAKGIEIIDLAVNPASGTAYLAVRKQDDKRYIVFTVNGAGKIGELDLDKATYARLALDGGKSKISVVTDVAWADDRVIAAGRSNEEFASKIFSINAPISHEETGATFSAETYHVSHRRWETKAPMSVVIPFKENGQTYVVGAFSCTPIVKYPIEALQPGASVKGTSVVELGSGNRPIDMFVYEKDGKVYVLTNTFRFHHERKPFGPSPFWTVRFEQGVLAEDTNVNEQALRRLKANYQPANDKFDVVESFHGVEKMDKLDDRRALVLRAGNLEPLPLP